MDLLVKAELENIERLRAALRAAYRDDPCIEEIRPEDLLVDYPVVRYCPPDSDPCFDLIIKLDEIATFESGETEIKEVDGIHVRVAAPAALHRLTKGIVRPIDHQDVAALRERFDPQETDWMGVQRFRSIDDMNAIQLRRGATDGFETLVRHNARIRALSPRPKRRGVFRFRNLTEAQSARLDSFSVLEES